MELYGLDDFVCVDEANESGQEETLMNFSNKDSLPLNFTETSRKNPVKNRRSSLSSSSKNRGLSSIAFRKRNLHKTAKQSNFKHDKERRRSREKFFSRESKHSEEGLCNENDKIDSNETVSCMSLVEVDSCDGDDYNSGIIQSQDDHSTSLMHNKLDQNPGISAIRNKSCCEFPLDDDDVDWPVIVDFVFGESINDIIVPSAGHEADIEENTPFLKACRSPVNSLEPRSEKEISSDDRSQINNRRNCSNGRSSPNISLIFQQNLDNYSIPFTTFGIRPIKNIRC